VVTCEVTLVVDNGIEVSILPDGAQGFIRRADLSRDRSEQRPERFAVGDKVDARVTNVDKSNRRLTLSIKAREVMEDKEAVAQYGSSDSGASLGDILGAAINKAAKKKGKAEPSDAEAEAADDAATDEAETGDAEAADDAATDEAEAGDAKAADDAATDEAETGDAKAADDAATDEAEAAGEEPEAAADADESKPED